MLRWTPLSIFCLLCATNSTRADIEVWEGNPAHCTISDVNNTIQINEPGTYGFRAWNGDDENPALEDIQDITIDSGVDDEVTVMIAYNEYGDNGAVNLRQGNLTVDGYEVYLAGLEISGNIATTGDFICDNISGTVDIDGDIGVTAGTRKFFVQNAEAPIIVHGRLRAYNTLEAETLGDVTICSHPTQGDIKIKNNYSGTLTISPIMYGDIRIGERDPNGIVTTASDLTGTLSFGSQLLGDVDITDDLATYEGVSGRIVVGSDLNGGHILIADAVTQADPNLPAIHVEGDITGSAGSESPIEVVGELNGVIAIDGSLDNASSGPEIQVGSLDPNDPNSLGAITIDYNGYTETDDWDPNAVIIVDTTSYTENTPIARVYRVTNCNGDLDNDEDLDGDDLTAIALSGPAFAASHPGLLGSRLSHGDVDDTGYIDGVDEDFLEWFVDDLCSECMDDTEFTACYADIAPETNDGVVGLGDLAALLAGYGTTSGATREDGDMDLDGDVQLSDLATLLGVYGEECSCHSTDGGGEGGEDGSAVTVTVEAYNTSGYSGGGFSGEVDHFVFDLKIEVNDPNNDDWVVTGAALEADNGATFRLSSTPTTPDQYATFVAAPWTSVPGSATATVAGTYDPPDPNEVFTARNINLGWYDSVESSDGPATVMRIVIDVSEVTGADVSEGFGSVYFSTTGPVKPSDIFLADLAAGTSTAESAPTMESLSGEFYVKGSAEEE